jgi:hypothetical protein
MGNKTYVLRDCDVVDAAEVLIASHGNSALVEAEKRAQTCTGCGDAASAKNWRRVADTIRQFMPGRDHYPPLERKSGQRIQVAAIFMVLSLS